MIFDEYGFLENSTYIDNLLFYEFNITMETNVGYASWINGNNKQHNRSTHNTVMGGLIDSNQYVEMESFKRNIS